MGINSSSENRIPRIPVNSQYILAWVGIKWKKKQNSQIDCQDYDSFKK